MALTDTIKVSIDNLWVGITEWGVEVKNFGFNFTLKNKHKEFKGTHKADHDWEDREAFKELLVKSYALELALGYAHRLYND